MKTIDLKNKAISAQDLERLELLQRANEKKGTQLQVDIASGDLKEFDEIRAMVKKDFENPQEKYDIYYKGINRILRKYLPKGKEHEAGRNLIYDEKNIFLSLGKRKSDSKDGTRGADGRMTYQPIMKDMLDLIVGWVSESQDPIALYDMIWELNEKMGYGHENYDSSSKETYKAKRKVVK
jgi:hypothetical protein